MGGAAGRHSAWGAAAALLLAVSLQAAEARELASLPAGAFRGDASCIAAEGISSVQLVLGRELNCGFIHGEMGFRPGGSTFQLTNLTQVEGGVAGSVHTIRKDTWGLVPDTTFELRLSPDGHGATIAFVNRGGAYITCVLTKLSSSDAPALRPGTDREAPLPQPPSHSLEPASSDGGGDSPSFLGAARAISTLIVTVKGSKCLAFGNVMMRPVAGGSGQVLWLWGSCDTGEVFECGFDSGAVKASGSALEGVLTIREALGEANVCPQMAHLSLLLPAPSLLVETIRPFNAPGTAFLNATMRAQVVIT